MKLKKNESLSEFYIRFTDRDIEGLTFNDFFKAAKVPKKNRNEFALASIMKGVKEILDSKSSQSEPLS